MLTRVYSYTMSKYFPCMKKTILQGKYKGYDIQISSVIEDNKTIDKVFIWRKNGKTHSKVMIRNLETDKFERTGRNG